MSQDQIAKQFPEVSRRSVLIGLGAGAAAISGVSAPFISRAEAAEPIKIGLLAAKQGPWANGGLSYSNGLQIALNEINNQINGRPVQVIWYDESGPQVAAVNMEKLIKEDKVTAVVGGMISSSALAVGLIAQRERVPFFTPATAATEITGASCNPFMFRGIITCSIAAKLLAPVAFKEYGKKWYFLTHAYAFGEDIYRRMRTELDAGGGTEVGVDRVPIGTTDFSSYLLKIRSAQPDVVIDSVTGGDYTTLANQYTEFGLNGKIPIVLPLISDDEIWAAGQNVVRGYYGKDWDYGNPDGPPEMKAFVKTYIDAYKDVPSSRAGITWMGARLLLKAIGEAKTLEGKDIVTALHNLKLKYGSDDIYFRSWDNEMVHPCTILKRRENATGSKDILEVVSNVAPTEQIFGSQGSSDCKMAAL